MKSKLLFISITFLFLLTSCNNSSKNTISAEAFSSAINFSNYKSFSYTLLGAQPNKTFVDDVEIDNNKLHVIQNDSITGIKENYTESINDKDYLYSKDNSGAWKKEEGASWFVKMFKPTYYFTKFVYGDFTFIKGSGRYVSNKAYDIDNYHIISSKLRFDNNQLIDASLVMLDKNSAINYVMDYTYTYKSVTVNLPPCA